VAVAFLDSVVIATPFVCARADPDDGAPDATSPVPNIDSEVDMISMTDRIDNKNGTGGCDVRYPRRRLQFGTSCIKRMTFLPAASSEGAYRPLLPPLLTVISRPEAQPRQESHRHQRDREDPPGGRETPSPPLLAAAWSGLGSDAAWVRVELARAAQDAFEQYGSRAPAVDEEGGDRTKWQLLTVTSALHELRSLYRRFWNYRVPGGGEDGGGSWDWRTTSGVEGDDGGWARPIGVTTLLVQAGVRQQQHPTSVRRDDENPQAEALSAGSEVKSHPTSSLSSKIYVIEPSGIVRFPVPITVSSNAPDNVAPSVTDPNKSTMSNGETPASTLRPSSMAIACIGKSSGEAQRRIERQWKTRKEGARSNDMSPDSRPSTLDDVPEWLARVLAEVLVAEGDCAGKKASTKQSLYLQVEIVSPRGVEQRVVDVIPSPIRTGL
jgi:hypothetical protein